MSETNKHLYRYTITLHKLSSGWKAVCSSFPEIAVTGKGKNSTYTKMKQAVRGKVREMIEKGERPPRDDTQTKHYIVDISLFQDESMLR